MYEFLNELLECAHRVVYASATRTFKCTQRVRASLHFHVHLHVRVLVNLYIHLQPTCTNVHVFSDLHVRTPVPSHDKMVHANVYGHVSANVHVLSIVHILVFFPCTDTCMCRCMNLWMHV